ncbi:MAG: hypothetical protein UW88_C0006G0046 [Candidatus Collierbacteria bacterium GW2011_GWD2_45_10]|uniref:Uncharacterized protein n=1 Tax=Candidatus Collierbacteria bacterium GW2011_GWB2_44_22 TaxID=1618387 RepID=A0A0G1I0G6_9BACT|nr:MAG: hypothetical protein UW31_C0007G0087 [Candidatus Collierbacteria bacterium GW2011_GWA2_44_13]KKT49153.1 MAG: hypothetical protein UW42_C0039G0002 [Candidatus Collierbacteria bacterium GW2011_GWB1_44_197]KKT52318.1 MAG: hypothetical protein UW44_C0003G0161 [Candidatus Collierbacteria bacterium GW2011_GWB2_44_22]KKT63238.1 MAG: hypothetical protein UW56_C0001G0075 [Candidatus Collierbacteria bacterium GW2011_GWD1_44_27]KKT64518.1 MAG: hypothetical protein UW58_C0041G0008 [Candidatus Colli
MNNLETARSPENAITIISEDECKVGLKELRKIFNEMFPDPQEVSIIPILRSGFRLGRELTDHLGIKMNPMQMSYYRNDTSRLPSPVCLTPPDITKIISIDGTTKQVVFTECVVDSQETVLAAMKEINRMIDVVGEEIGRKLDYPEYFTFAYVSKTADHPVEIPNMVAAFSVHPDVWVGGLGCDLPGDMSRDLSYLVGILSPFATRAPKKPYFVPLLT